MGSGILFLPNGFQEGGWLFGIIAMFVSVIVTFYCIYLLIKVKLKVGGSYSDIGQMAWGKFGKYITDICIAVA